MDDETPSLLVVLLDTSTPFWRTREIQRFSQQTLNPQEFLVTFQETLEALLVFLEAYLLMHRGNDVAIFAASNSGSRALYPPPAVRSSGGSLPGGDVGSGDLRACLVEGLKRLAAHDNAVERAAAAAAAVAAGGGGAAGGGAAGGQAAAAGGGGAAGGEPQPPRFLAGPAVAKALSQGLCYVNRLMMAAVPGAAAGAAGAAAGRQPRVLVLQGSPDVPDHYNAVMNAIFSAQKARVPVDCCVLGTHSMFLEQAAYLSGGMYLQAAKPGALPAMLATFLPSPSCRKYLGLKRQDTVDMRAACFCHRRVVEIAYVCTVCLSVFCGFSNECSTCGAIARPAKRANRRPAGEGGVAV